MTRRNLSLHVALLLSGAAALVYQATWGRMLHRVFGVSDLAIATVLASFFLGMGLGAAFGGRIARRFERPALVYGVLELLVGLWALLSIALVPRVHEVYAAMGADASFGALTTVRFGLAFAILLPPTLFMGATLPVLIAAVARGDGDWESHATGLYATNTLGATLGAALAGLYLVPEWGTRPSITAAACASFAAAAVVLATFGLGAHPAPLPPDEAAGAPKAKVSRRAALAIGLAAVAGFASLAGEVLWTRVLRTVVQGTTQAFSAMLVQYLLGIVLGSLLADRLVTRGRSATLAFGVCQLLLGLFTVLALVVAPHLPRVVGLLQGSEQLVPTSPWIVLATSAALLLPLTITLGTAIPLAFRIAGDSHTEAPRHAGRVLAANTLGGLLGSLGAGFFLVPTFGIQVSILVVLFVHLTAASMALQSAAGARLAARLGATLGPPALGVLVLLADPSLHLPFLLDAWWDPSRAIIEGPREDWGDPILYIEEGRNTTVTLLRREGGYRLYNDGRPESGLGVEDPGFGPELAVLGGLPNVLADERQRAMVVGLGAGHTTTVLLSGPYQRVDVVELEGAIVEAARTLHEHGGRRFPLSDDRAHLVVDDARARLNLSEPATYDAIVSQPSHPWLAGASGLYTREFFQECERALKPGGVLSLWINLFRMEVRHLRSVVRTLLEVFDEVNAFVVESSSFILVAGDRPLRLDERAAARLGGDAGLGPYLGPYHLDTLVELGAMRELDAAGARAFAEGGEVLVDDRPVLETALARLPYEHDLELRDLDYALRDIPWIGVEDWGSVPIDLRAELLVERIDEEGRRLRVLDRVALALPELTLTEDERHLVEGALAEARGDVTGALAGYDASRLGWAAFRADRLRYRERMYESLLAHGRHRDNPPDEASFLLSAALALRDRDAARAALEVAARIDAAPDRQLARAVRAWTEHGCEGFLGEGREAVESVLDDEHVAEMAQRCAIQRDDPEAQRYADRWIKVRQVISGNEARRADNVVGSNPGQAMRGYRRAVLAMPTNGHAAAEWAKLLWEAGYQAEATAILRDAHDRIAGLPNASRAVSDAASSLGVDLTAETPPPAASP